MANASVELGGWTLGAAAGTAIHNRCVRQEALAISGATATLAAAVTAAEVADGVMIARITTDDTACYVAIGPAPDPTATAKTSTTGARRFIPAGGSIELPVAVGDKVAVHA